MRSAKICAAASEHADDTTCPSRKKETGTPQVLKFKILTKLTLHFENTLPHGRAFVYAHEASGKRLPKSVLLILNMRMTQLARPERRRQARPRYCFVWSGHSRH